MDYINGLEFFQKALSVEQREGIFEELKGYIAQALKPTRPGRIEAVDGSGIFDPPLPGGPFTPLNLLRSFIHVLAMMLSSNLTNIVRLGPKFKPWEIGNIAQSSHIRT